MIDELVEGYYLVTVADWLVGTDGVAYQAVWGKCKVVKDEDMLGVRNRSGANWAVKVDGKNNTSLYILGCQVKFIQECPFVPVGGQILKMGAKVDSP